MSNLPKKTILDKNGNNILPITHISAVYDDNGTSAETLFTIINEQIEDNKIVKGYLSSGAFYTETQTIITPSTDKLYIDTITNKMYIYNGSVYVEICVTSEKQDKISVVSQAASSFTAAIDKYYDISSNVGTMTITLPTMTDSTKTAGLMILFTTGSSPALTINSESNLTISYFSDYAIEADSSYELNCLWNGTKWIIAYGTIE